MAITVTNTGYIKRTAITTYTAASGAAVKKPASACGLA